MEQRIDGLMEVTLKDDVYQVDIPGERLVLKDDPEHWIHYEHMYFRNGGYEFCYDPKRQYIDIPFESSEDAVMVNLPSLIDTDQKAMLAKYDLKAEDLTIGELQALKDQEAALLYRLKGNLPIIDIASSAYVLDVNTLTLRPLHQGNEMSIFLPAFANGIGDKGFQFLFHRASGSAYNIAENNFRSGYKLTQVKLPALEIMDPIGMATKAGRHPLHHIWTHPQRQWTKAYASNSKQHFIDALLNHENPGKSEKNQNQHHKRKPKIRR